MTSLILIEKGIYVSFTLIAFFINVLYTYIIYDDVFGRHPELSTSDGRYVIFMAMVLMIKLLLFVLHVISQTLSILKKFSNKTSTIYVAITATMINVVEIVVFFLFLFAEDYAGRSLDDLIIYPEIFLILPTAAIYFFITLIHLITLTVYTRNQTLVTYTELQQN